MLYYTTLYYFVSCNTVLYSTHYSIMCCLISLILHTLQYHVLLDPSDTPHTTVSCTAWSLWYSTHYSIMYCLIPLILYTLIQTENKKMIGIENKYPSILQCNYRIVLLLNYLNYQITISYWIRHTILRNYQSSSSFNMSKSYARSDFYIILPY